ncbi:MAG TPA: RND transporter, partial [Bacteroidales bacterium]|nr:RND transporter [Bacteroidales bacterium]
PSMTTSNQIVTQKLEDVISVPLEAIHSDDSLSYVYTVKGKKQIILSSEQNENYIIVEKGLDEGEEVYLSMPANIDKYSVAGKEIIPEIKKRELERKRKEEEIKAANEQQAQKAQIPRGNGRTKQR